MHRLVPLLLLTSTLSGCAWITESEQAARWDVDGDAVPRPTDCDDANPDLGDAPMWFRDQDKDGWGDPAHSQASCEQPEGYVDADGDCNDLDPDIHPEAEEICDGLDNNCSGVPDDDAQLITFYADRDGDSWGDENDVVGACVAPTGYVALPGDCNDAVSTINPDADEVCNGADDDCDGAIDLVDPDLDPDEATWYEDSDGDGWGNPDNPLMSCDPLVPGYDRDSGDCDDTDPALNPDADEVCFDAIDNDCDGVTDEDSAVDAPIWFADTDGDGYGDAAVILRACSQPGGHRANAGDCDDTDPNVHPSAPEICNGIDDDCDTLTDDDDPFVNEPPRWYLDLDGDSFGDSAFSTQACIAPAQYVPTAGDCLDDDPAVFPDAEEICNGIDDDCDQLADEFDPDLSPFELTTWYLDGDRDGYGSPVQTAIACEAPPLHVANFDDCNDLDEYTYPGAPEICDGLDNSCEGLVDEGVVPTWFTDADGDGVGSGVGVTQCTPPQGSVSVDGDCDDNEPATFPGAVETCDGLDNDCNYLVDEQDPALVADAWYLDVDQDGFGDPNNTIASCDQPADHVANDDDCDDSNAAVNADAVEICDGLDNDCDLLTDDDDESLQAQDWFEDLDADGFGSGPAIAACAAPTADFVAQDGDCEPTDPSVNPGADEVCDSADNDCDGLVDDDDDDVDLATARQAFADTDSDGFGDAAAPWASLTCSAPDGYVFDDTDCDDASNLVFPGAPEFCDGLDNSCSGVPDDTCPERWYEDADGDQRGNPLSFVDADYPPPGYVFDNSDCNDANATVYLDAPELCDSIDNDCDTLIDDDDDDVAGSTWYLDQDVDFFGRDDDILVRCQQPDGYAAIGGDCDDFRDTVYAGADELCDFIDNDCDGLIDDTDPDVLDASAWFPDADFDGFGDSTSVIVSCTPPEFSVLDNADCDDLDFKINPAALEVCDTQDNNCDGLIDDADPQVADQTDWFDDLDGDGWGDPNATATTACFAPPNSASNASDCNDADRLDYPGAPERCDLRDNDCDGIPDNNLVYIDWFADLDMDGWGDPATMVNTCDPPAGYVDNAFDCNDTIAAIAPGEPELCGDNIDNDCDGLVDGDDPISIGSFMAFLDADGDGQGDPTLSIMSCGDPAYVENDTDCDDTDASIYLDAPLGPLDVGDGVDRDCDTFDECFTDGDGDGFDGETIIADDGDGLCDSANEGWVAEDCDDTNPLVFPGAAITASSVADGVDNDCDGFEECYSDSDGDGAGQALVINDIDGDGLCLSPGEATNSDDCDDSNPLRFPASLELCGDGIDNDCDGEDESTQANPTPVVWYLDQDGDGYGDPAVSATLCDPPSWFVADATDCDDGSAWAVNRYPGAPESCDYIDTDCDGLSDPEDPDLVGCSRLNYVNDDFACGVFPSVGLVPKVTGWQATWAGDWWAMDGDGTVHPTNTNTAFGSQGLPPDSNENFLVVGDAGWADVEIEATLLPDVSETMGMGLVGRYPNANNYYSCLVTNTESPGCDGIPVPGSRVVLTRYESATCLSSDQMTVDEVAWSYTPGIPLRIRLEVDGSDIRCVVDSDYDGLLGSVGDIELFHDDSANPLSPGAFGLMSYGASPLSRFDNVLITGKDPDDDLDGVTNLNEDALQSDRYQADSDLDGILDTHEIGHPAPAFERDADSDLLADSVDPDSDNDGIPDLWEAGDFDLTTIPVDTDCDGLADHVDNDSDADGILDVDDNCRILSNAGQADLDGDGLGDPCDPTPTDPDGDMDGLVDGLEAQMGSDPNQTDTDGDGLLDGDEVLLFGTDPTFADTDTDGLSDMDEINVYGTDPLLFDTDGNGVGDGEERI